MLRILLLLVIIASPCHSSLYTTPEDIARARVNMRRFAWAQAAANDIIRGADFWAGKSDAELRAVVPPPGSTFAYGFSGCPECSANWSWWGENGIASLDKPGLVTCPGCNRTFPDAEHPDSGAGWTRSSDGKVYYFLGVYNSFAIRRVTYALKFLSQAYAITGERKYSRAASLMFDSLADTYPARTEGAADYPYSKNTGRIGRLELAIYMAARTLDVYAYAYSLLRESPDFAQPSLNGNTTISQHVLTDIIENGGSYCHEELSKGYMGLANGGADYLRGSVAAGVLLDRTDWLEYAIKGPFSIENFIQNTIDREGHYYESSLGYAEHALSIFVSIAEMLYNYRSSAYPDGVNLYTHPRFTKALSAGLVDLDCFGHAPRFGDWWPDFTVVTTDRLYSWYPYIYSELLIARAADEETRRKWEAQREATAFLGVEEMRSRPLVSDWRQWMLFHAEPVSVPDTKPALEQRPLLGGRGIAIARSGKGETGRAVLVRFGPTLNHGHLDSMGLHFYALGRDLTYDLGYQLGSAHVQTSWARLTASHNLVVVNEKNQMVVPSPGGDVRFFAEAAPIKVFEASDPSCYATEKVTDYSRTTALVDIPGGSSYLLDIFRVAGGEKHDLMWHFSGEMESVTGAALGRTEETGSLAGPEIDWGRKVGPAGDLIGSGDKPPYWNAPPGNGYGFLHNLRRSSSLSHECQALWSVDTEGPKGVLLRLLPEPGSQLITARAPGILPDNPKADYAVLRREGADLRSAFVSVVEPVDGDSAITSVRRLDAGGAICVVVESGAGTDYLFSAAAPGRVVFELLPGLSATFDGRFGFVRIKDGRVRRALLVEGTQLTLGEHSLTSPRREIVASVVSVEHCGTVVLDRAIPEQQAGTYVYLSRVGYTHNSAYRVSEHSEDGRILMFDTDFVLARGRIGDEKPEDPSSVRSQVPLPVAIDMWSRPNGYLRDKTVRSDRTGKTTGIIDVTPNQYTLQLADPGVMSEGDSFTVLDVRAGDMLRIPAVVIR